MNSSIVVIRRFKPEDQKQVSKLIYEGTMITVNRFFYQFLTREAFLQTVVLFTALTFIFMRVHLFTAVFASLPIVVVLAYLCIWGAHFYKVKYLHPDMQDVEKTYMSSDKTSFIVAEAFYNDIKDDRVIPTFINESELERMDGCGPLLKEKMMHHEIVGTVAITRAKDSSVIAWLRRMVVTKNWRRKQVGAHLVDAAVKFCSQKGFVGIELLTTECHDSAKCLYEKKGFIVEAFYHKKFLGLFSFAVMMQLMHFKTRPFKSTALNL